MVENVQFSEILFICPQPLTNLSGSLGLDPKWWQLKVPFLPPKGGYEAHFICQLLCTSVVTCLEDTWRMDSLISNSQNLNAGRKIEGNAYK